MIVKICGLTRVEDAQAAAAAGADMIGLVFAESPRRVNTERAKKISGAAGSGVRKVGVFVNEDPDEINRIVLAVGLDLVQLHGQESPADCSRLAVGVIKAFRVKDDESLSHVHEYRYCLDFVLLDSYIPGQVGGTGTAFDWSIVEGLKDWPVPWLLAGGLDPKNVAEAIKRCHPAGVDVSGGVEISPGLKDHALITKFIERAKGGYCD